MCLAGPLQAEKRALEPEVDASLATAAAEAAVTSDTDEDMAPPSTAAGAGTGEKDSKRLKKEKREKKALAKLFPATCPPDFDSAVLGFTFEEMMGAIRVLSSLHNREELYDTARCLKPLRNAVAPFAKSMSAKVRRGCRGFATRCLIVCTQRP